jgi:hypothetical protein
MKREKVDTFLNSSVGCRSEKTMSSGLRDRLESHAIHLSSRLKCLFEQSIQKMSTQFLH